MATVNVDVTFSNGIGEVDVTLNGNNKVTLTTTGRVTYQAQSTDIIGIDGTFNGGGKIEIDLPTDPSTPDERPDGRTDIGYVII